MPLHPLVQLALDRKSIVEDSWRGIALKVIPTVAKESTQYIEMRKTFYCGFFAAFNLMQDVSINITSEDHAAIVLENIEKMATDEIRKFAKWNSL